MDIVKTHKKNLEKNFTVPFLQGRKEFILTSYGVLNSISLVLLNQNLQQMLQIVQLKQSVMEELKNDYVLLFRCFSLSCGLINGGDE